MCVSFEFRLHRHHTSFFFFNDTATTEIYTLSLHDALPICHCPIRPVDSGRLPLSRQPRSDKPSHLGKAGVHGGDEKTDRKSTRLNSSHLVISYAVFCLKKKTTSH